MKRNGEYFQLHSKTNVKIPSLLLCEYMTSETSGLTRTAPIGIYAEERAWMKINRMYYCLDTDWSCHNCCLSSYTFAIDTRSGFMLYFSQPNIVPSLPNAHITSSAMNKMSYFLTTAWICMLTQKKLLNLCDNWNKERKKSLYLLPEGLKRGEQVAILLGTT